jgi:uncharacterized protein YggE
MIRASGGGAGDMGWRGAIVAAALVIAAPACTGPERAVSTRLRQNGSSVAASASDANAGGVTALGRGTTTVSADEVYVVLSPGSDPFEFGQTISERDRTEIVAALEDVGVASEDIAIEVGSPETGEPTEVHVELAVDQLPEMAKTVESTVEEVIGRVGTKGLVFGVSDCESVLGPARRAAAEDARSVAERLGDLFDFEVGSLRDVAEAQDLATFDGTVDPCALDRVSQFLNFYGTELEEFNAKPELELAQSLTATYAIKGAQTAIGITATGRGHAAIPADRATVVIAQSLNIGGSSQVTDPLAVDVLRERLVRDGIPARDVKIDGGGFVSGTIVQVRVDVDAVAKTGDRIVDAVEEVLGSVSDSGVVFSTSDCTKLVDLAEKAAAEDAEARIEGIADGAGVDVGAVVSAAELGPFDAATASLVVDDNFNSYIGTPLADTFASCGATSLLTINPKPFDSDPVTELDATIVVTRHIS